MDQPLHVCDSLSSVRSSGVARVIVAAASLLVVGLMAGAAALWMHYGTTVFFEMVKSGIAACI